MQRLSSWPLLWLLSSLRWTSTRDRLTDLAAEEGRVRAQIKSAGTADKPKRDPAQAPREGWVLRSASSRRRDALGSCDSTSVSIATALLQALPSRLLVRDRDAVFRVRGEEHLITPIEQSVTDLLGPSSVL
jgi:hypothetical protein